jgi:DNA helicase-2/ATP-dependent DNA helicase PcrA
MGAAAKGIVSQNNLPSRFLKELDNHFVRQETVRRPRLFEARDTETPRHARDEQAMPDYENESQAGEGMQVGRLVNHPQFGLGEILAAEGTGENLKLTIAFEKAGKKKILVKYGHLQLL